MAKASDLGAEAWGLQLHAIERRQSFPLSPPEAPRKRGFVALECRAAWRSALDRPQPGLAFFRRVGRRSGRIPFKSCPGGPPTTDGDHLRLPPDAARRARKRPDRLLRRFSVGAPLWIVERAFRSLAARPGKSSRRWSDIRVGWCADPVYAHGGFTRVV